MDDRRSDRQGTLDGEVSDPLGHDQSVVGGGKAHPMEGAMRLGQQVLPTVGGVAFGHHGDNG